MGVDFGPDSHPASDLAPGVDDSSWDPGLGPGPGVGLLGVGPPCAAGVDFDPAALAASSD
eukprot:6233268-Pyramimonas_sp.AAC.3